MLCVSCKVDINPLFKYAMENNICPSCGGCIMDEETVGLIQDIKETISNEIKLRDETIYKVAIILLSKYNISYCDNIKQNVVNSNSNLKQEKIKITPSSFIKNLENTNTDDKDIIKAEDVIVDGVSDEEREKIMEDVIKKRYVLIDQLQNNIEYNDDNKNSLDGSNLFIENADPLLETERLNRLAIQKKINSGVGKLRRR